MIQRLLLLLAFPANLSAQIDTAARVQLTDTSYAVVTAFGRFRPEKQSLPSLHAIDGAKLDRDANTSLLTALNALPGVRMEERSPGSYRLNMRGSTLRSPFGVRNVKIYYNGIPFTDAGGNSYFNQLSFVNLSSIEIAKGPAGSMYGAGTGGLVLLHSLRPFQEGLEAELTGGSFGLLQVSAKNNWKKNSRAHTAGMGYVRQNGYREHTRMHRWNGHYSGTLWQKGSSAIRSHVLASDMYYQTPGGLTQSEYTANPRQARPRAGALPSAQEADAAIFQQNILGGITATQTVGKKLMHESTVYGSFAQVRNAAIRNFEQRSEPGWGGRSVFSRIRQQAAYTEMWHGGGEAQWGHFATRVFTNIGGSRGNPITSDKLRFFTWNAFLQWQRQYGNRWDVSAGISYYTNRVQVRRIVPSAATGLQRNYSNDWAPRLTVIYRPAKQIQISGLISRGFSPPTVSELLPGTGILNGLLRPEYGWNMETGIRIQTKDGKFSSSLNYFRFALRDALVQRRDSTGGDFYTNAGGTMQQGIEWQASALWLRPQAALQIVRVSAAYAWSHFRYTAYRQGNNRFDGNHLPSVPAHTLSLQFDMQWRSSLFVKAGFYGQSSLWLNDANTAKATGFFLPQLKIGFGRNTRLFAGVDNLLNETYSLGNDINAAGGRFFNAAPTRNWYAGIRFQIK